MTLGFRGLTGLLCHCLIAVAIVLAVPATAQTAEEQLAAMNTYLERGFLALEFVWTTAAPAEQGARITSAEQVSATVKRGLTPQIQASTFYPPLAARLAALDDRIAGARLAHACFVARQAAVQALGRRDAPAARQASEVLGGHIKKLSVSRTFAPLSTSLAADKRAIDGNAVLLEKSLVEERKALQKQEIDRKRRVELEELARAKAEVDARAGAQKAAAAAARAEQEAARVAASQRLAEERALELANAKADAVEREGKARADAEAKAREKAAVDARAKDAAANKERLRQEALASAAEAKVHEAEAREKEKNDPRRALALVIHHRDELEQFLRARNGPIQPKQLAAARGALSELRRLDEPRSRLEGALIDLAVIRSAARQSGATPLDAVITRTLSPTTTTSTFDLWESWCYIVVSSTEAHFTGMAESTTLLTRFAQAHTTSGQLSGWCTQQAGKATLTITREDSRGTVVVFGWPQKKVPLAVMLHARLVELDACDEAAVGAAWQGALPGSVVFVQPGSDAPAGPALILDPGTSTDVSALVLRPTGLAQMVGKGQLTDGALAGASNVMATPEIPSEQCPLLGARILQRPDSSMCRQRSDQMAREPLRRLTVSMAEAKDDDGRRVLEHEIGALADEASRQRSRDCAPYEVSPARAFRHRHLQQVLTQPPVGTGRSAVLAIESGAAP